MRAIGGSGGLVFKICLLPSLSLPLEMSLPFGLTCGVGIPF